MASNRVETVAKSRRNSLEKIRVPLLTRVLSIFAPLISAWKAVWTRSDLTDFQRNGGVMPPYTPPANSHTIRTIERAVLIGLIGFCFIYGFTFVLLGIYLPVLPLIPIFLLSIGVIWAIPDNRSIPPGQIIDNIYFICIVNGMLWPAYLVVTLPGLPWITSARLFCTPLDLLVIYLISTNPIFRNELLSLIRKQQILSNLVGIFFIFCVFETIASRNIAMSIGKLIVAIQTWFGFYLIGLFYFRKPNRFYTVAVFMLIAIYIESGLGIWEYKLRVIPWIRNIPEFLKPDPETLHAVMEKGNRAYTNEYRVHGTYTIQLQFGEIIGFTWTFILYLLSSSKKPLIRALSIAAVPLMFLMCVLNGSRTPFVLLVPNLAIFGLAWVLRLRRTAPTSLVTSSISFGLPILAASTLPALFTIGKFRKLFLGGGETQASTQARMDQWNGGIPKILSHPWGWGIGQGGSTLGYFAPDGTLTIDSYILVLLLEYGPIGTLVFCAMFFYGIHLMLRTLWRQLSSDRIWECVALASFCAAFLLSKVVFAQEYDHWLPFVILAAIANEPDHCANADVAQAGGPTDQRETSGRARARPRARRQIAAIH